MYRASFILGFATGVIATLVEQASPTSTQLLEAGLMWGLLTTFIAFVVMRFVR